MSESKYKVSLLVPIYGVEKYIEKFARTALGQTYQDIQFVFVNDGTKDSSMEILHGLIDAEFAHLKGRIVIVNKENAGLPAARKTGLEHAEGEYILFADSDDWLELDAVEKVMAKAEETDADIVYFDLVKEYGHRSSYKRERDYTGETKMDFIVNMFNYKSFGYTVTKCFKRKLYTDNVIYIPKLGMHEDIYLMSQLLYHAGSIVHLPSALYHYRRDNPGSISAAKRENRRRDSAMNMMDLYERYKDDLRNSPICDSYGEILFRTGWLSIRYGFGFFEKYPYLAQHIRKEPLSFKNKTFILWQVITKMRALFR